MDEWQNAAKKRFGDEYDRKRSLEKDREAQRQEIRDSDDLRKNPGPENLKNFVCHICGVVAKEPGSEIHQGVSGAGESCETSYYKTLTFKVPGDLAHCHYCGRWTCKNDSFVPPGRSLMCKNCAKLPSFILDVRHLIGGWS